jgi:hypothetical protein
VALSDSIPSGYKGALLLLVLLPLRGPALEDPNPDALDLPPVMARVNGRVIGNAEVEARIAQVRSMDPDRFSRMSREQKQRAVGRVVNDLVIRAVELEEAAAQGVSASEAETDALFRAEARASGGERAFGAALREAGSSAAEWKRQMRDVLSIRRIEARALGASPPPRARAEWIAGLRNRDKVWLWSSCRQRRYYPGKKGKTNA